MNSAIILLQARSGSVRFPQKVLQNVQGIPLLSHCIRRLKRISKEVPVIVITSNFKRDDDIAKTARSENVCFFRGSEEDVLDRFYKAARAHDSPKFIIRATGDNPLVDPEEARKVFDVISTNKCDYVTGFMDVNGKGLPKGIGVEAFSMIALQTAWLHGHKPQHREHINDYFFEHKDQFNIYHVPCPEEKSSPELNLSVDHYKELNFILSLSLKIGKPLLELKTEEIVSYCKSTKVK